MRVVQRRYQNLVTPLHALFESRRHNETQSFCLEIRFISESFKVRVILHVHPFAMSPHTRLSEPSRSGAELQTQMKVDPHRWTGHPDCSVFPEVRDWPLSGQLPAQRVLSGATRGWFVGDDILGFDRRHRLDQV